MSGCDDDQMEKKRREPPSNWTVTFSGIIAVLGLLASGAATYNNVQNDIAVLKRDIVYQAQTNDLNRQDRIAIRAEQSEKFEKIDGKIERLIDLWSPRRSR